jgi:hypothetical protein
MTSLMNDACILQVSNLYCKVMNGELLELHQGQIKPYLFGDKRYSLRSWLMIIHKQVVINTKKKKQEQELSQGHNKGKKS